MKNNFSIILFIFFLNFLSVFNANSSEVFNFDVTEIEILEKGNIFLGKKGGIATSEDGTTIKALNFKYNKELNILYAKDNVILHDIVNNVKIYTDDITYLKNEEIIFTESFTRISNEDSIITGNSFTYKRNKNLFNGKDKVILEDLINEVKIYTDDITYLKNEEIIFTESFTKITDKTSTMIGDQFNYERNKNIFNGSGNVEINDYEKDFTINANDITYNKNEELVFTKGKTTAKFLSKYDFKSSDVFLFKDIMELKSNQKSNLTDDNNNFYEVDEFNFLINEEILKGKNILAITNYQKPKSDKFFFSSGIFNLSSKEFISKDTKILLHKTLFDKERVSKIGLTDEEKEKLNRFNAKNDPRILGVSSSGNVNKTVINKGIFTSCKKNDKCTPWHITAEKITHDKIKKNIYYKNATLNILDFPVFYFPNFFHPDPSVDRRSGLLQPRLNKSNIVGTSITQPYYKVISDNKDYTFKPTIFDDRIYMFHNEYRQQNKKSSFIADFGYTKGYKSSNSNNRNSMSHLFSKANIDLDYDNYTNSKIDIFVEKVSMDTYLKIFEDILITDRSLEDDLKDHNTLTSGVKLTLDNEKFNFTSGITSYENLQKSKNDRYQYVFPYYSLSSTLYSDLNGSVNFSSNGNNTLGETNKLESKINNNLQYSSKNKYSKNGFVTNYNIYLKNLNSIGKDSEKYKSSPDLELYNINEISIEYPLEKILAQTNNFITPKVSFRINPSDMKDQSSESRLITTDNIFGINRLGITDSFESGKSLTFGIDYRKENKKNLDKYFEFKLATVFRDTPELDIPKSSSLYNKSSNLFGSLENKLSDTLTVDYNFALDNDLQTFEYNNINTEFNFNNFKTEFRFQESSGETGDSNFLENETSIQFDENNSLVFSTRRNRKISLTEFYNFIYEYQNDCITAAIKYKKTYYSDRDLIPKEDLFFTLTLFPLTTLDQKIDKKLYRDNNNDIIWK